MNKGSYKAIIVEGEVREPQVIESMLSVYFKEEQFKIISFPAEQNIYMLWKCLKKDEFETDIIEVVREYSNHAAKILEGLSRDDFSEVYLFFDYDGHQENLLKEEDGNLVLGEMLETFDNETELGKLYISYPMAEALRDFVPGQCSPATSCCWDLQKTGEYKTLTGKKSQYTHIRNYLFEEWSEILRIFSMRVSCLFGNTKVFSFEEYRNVVFPLSIYKYQQDYIQRETIFVLSAFPEFLLDYFKINFWKTHITYSKFRPETCMKA